MDNVGVSNIIGNLLSIYRGQRARAGRCAGGAETLRRRELSVEGMVGGGLAGDFRWG